MSLVSNIINFAFGKKIDQQVSARLAEEIPKVAEELKDNAVFRQASGLLVDYKKYGENQTQKPEMNYNILWLAYKTNEYVSGCVDAITKAITSGGWSLVENEDVSSHNEKNKKLLLEYYNKPNINRETTVMLMRNKVTDLGIFGNCFTEIVNDTYLGERYFETYALDTRSMTIKSDKHGYIEGYIQKVKDDSVTFEPDEVIHSRADNIGNSLYGQSPIEKLVKAITLYGMALNWNISFFKNSGRVNDVIKLGEKKTKADADLFLEFYSDKYIGQDNANRPFVTYGGIDVERDSRTMRDLEFVKILEKMRESIMAVYSVPPSRLAVIGYAKSGNNPEQDYKFRNDVIVPQRQQLEHAEDQQIIREKFQIEDYVFRFDDVADLRVMEAEQKYWTGMVKDGLYTPNEARTALGTEEHPDGDYLKGSKSDPSLKQAQATEPAKIAQKALPEPEIKIPEIWPYRSAEGYWRAFIKRTEKYERSFAGMIKKLYQLQEYKVMEKLRAYQRAIPTVDELKEWVAENGVLYNIGIDEELTKETAKIVVDAMQRANVDIEGVLFDAEKELERWQARSSEELEKVVGAEGQQFFSDMALEGKFDVYNPLVLEELQNKTYRFSDGQVKLATEMIRTQLSEGIANGESIHKLMDRIGSEYKALKGWKAERVARTEVIRASNFGTLESYKQSGIVTGKRWYTALDERLCDFCASMEGKLTDVQNEFFGLGTNLEVNGKVMAFNYEAIQHPPLHPACRCFLVPEILGETTSKVPQFTKQDSLKGCESYMKDLLKLDKCRYSGFTVNEANTINEAFYTYSSRYKTGLTAIDTTLRKPTAYGQVATSYEMINKKYLQKMTFNKKLLTDDKFQYVFSKAGIPNVEFLKYHVAVPEGTELLSVATHEFAHTIFNSGIHGGELRMKMNKVYGTYMRRLDLLADRLKTGKISKKVFEKKVKRDYISGYASYDVNEFWAESFTQYIHGETTSGFAREAIGIVNEYLGVK